MKLGSAFGISHFLRSYIWVVRAAVVVIALLVGLVGVGVVVLHPGTLEANAIGNERPYVFNSNLQSIEMGLKEGINVGGPVDRLRIDRAKFTQDHCAKRAKGSRPPSSLVVQSDEQSSSQSANAATNDRDKNGAPYGNGGVHRRLPSAITPRATSEVGSSAHHLSSQAV